MHGNVGMSSSEDEQIKIVWDIWYVYSRLNHCWYEIVQVDISAYQEI
jgi:hypothetical protein